mmetsp:Transcript_9545/g.20733  ORF Transcript_9545/g.20733 Transcript_9545/m.20733 type:complete len:91 (-) Transcript_9545:4462-4734(-)
MRPLEMEGAAVCDPLLEREKKGKEYLAWGDVMKVAVEEDDWDYSFRAIRFHFFFLRLCVAVHIDSESYRPKASNRKQVQVAFGGLVVSDG